jgi:hypothetical protein
MSVMNNPDKKKDFEGEECTASWNEYVMRDKYSNTTEYTRLDLFPQPFPDL